MEKCSYLENVHLLLFIREFILETLYECKGCLKVFSHLTELTVHEKIHSSEKLINLKHLRRPLDILQILRVHMRIPTGEKPCEREECEKAFSLASNLAQHGRYWWEVLCV